MDFEFDEIFVQFVVYPQQNDIGRGGGIDPGWQCSISTKFNIITHSDIHVWLTHAQPRGGSANPHSLIILAWLLSGICNPLMAFSSHLQYRLNTSHAHNTQVVFYSACKCQAVKLQTKMQVYEGEQSVSCWLSASSTRLPLSQYRKHYKLPMMLNASTINTIYRKTLNACEPFSLWFSWGKQQHKIKGHKHQLLLNSDF